jgi:hypothetical protein
MAGVEGACIRQKDFNNHVVVLFLITFNQTDMILLPKRIVYNSVLDVCINQITARPITFPES